MQRLLHLLMLASLGLMSVVATTPTPAHAVINRTKAINAIGVGVYQVSQGAAWQDLTATSFQSQTAWTPAAGDYFVSLSVANTHGSQSLYVTLQAGGATPTANTIEVQAGASVSLTHLLGASNKQHITTISVQGSGAATTGQIIAYFHRGAP